MCRVAGSSKQRASAALGKLKDVDLAKEINKLPDPMKQEIYRDTKSTVDNLKQGGLLEGRLSPVAQKIESCMESYAKYEAENPLKAKAALLSAMVLLKGAMGAAAGASGGVAGAVAGFGTGVFKGGADEMRGAAVDYVAGEYISAAMHKGIEKISPVFIELDSTLNPQQAAILGMALAAVTLSSHEFSSFAKSLKTADLSGLKIADGKVDGMIGFKNEVKSGHSVPSGHAVVKSGADAGGGFKHHIDIDADLLKREINLPSNLNDRKLRIKFNDHRDVFGMENLNFDKQNAELFKQRIVEHIKNPDTVAIGGQYLRGSVGDVVHYYNPKTKINVIKDNNGDFVSLWKLSGEQKDHLIKTGKIGGGR